MGFSQQGWRVLCWAEHGGFPPGESGKSLGCVEGIMGVRCLGSKEVMEALGTTSLES